MGQRTQKITRSYSIIFKRKSIYLHNKMAMCTHLASNTCSHPHAPRVEESKSACLKEQELLVLPLHLLEHSELQKAVEQIKNIDPVIDHQS